MENQESLRVSVMLPSELFDGISDLLEKWANSKHRIEEYSLEEMSKLHGAVQRLQWAAETGTKQLELMMQVRRNARFLHNDFPFGTTYNPNGAWPSAKEIDLGDKGIGGVL